MNRNQRHLQYRNSIYRKRRIKTVLLLCGAVLAVAFVIFLIVGNILHSKTEENPSGNNNTNNSTETTDAPLPAARQIGAYALPLLGNGSFEDRLSAIRPNANAVCINLNRADGTLLFSSSLAQSFTDLKLESGAPSLKDKIEDIEDAGFYTTAVLYIPSANDALLPFDDMELSLWAAIASEAIEDGVGDVLLICRSATEDDIERLSDLAAKIRKNVPKSTIGFALSSEIVSAENRERLINTLSTHFNYLALDTTLDRENNPLAFIESQISAMQYLLIRYNMRVMLPSAADSDTTDSYISKANEYSLNSWLVLPE